MKNMTPFKRISLFTIRKVILFSFIVSAIFTFGFLLGQKTQFAKAGQPVSISRNLPDSKKELQFSLFWRVWDNLEANYYDKGLLIPSEMIYGAIKGMVASIGDPYTVFLTPNENTVVQEDLQGSFEGVGIQIGFRSTRLAVISPLKDSPAEKAGILPGDYIARIIDKKKNIDISTSGITLPEAVQAIRGRAGSSVVLTLVREGYDEPLEIEVRRESIDIPSISLSYVGENENVALIKIFKFSGETTIEWDNAVREILKKSEVEAIILDVRNNPGGFLDASVDIASDFVDPGSVVVIEDRAGEQTEFKAEKMKRLGKYKLVMLVNGGSASASEILAGALRDNLGVKLVGEETFGKGTIQEPQQIDGGAGFHITIAKWLTPDGVWLKNSGLIPDEEILDDLETGQDEQLEKALEIVFN